MRCSAPSSAFCKPSTREREETLHSGRYHSPNQPSLLTSNAWLVFNTNLVWQNSCRVWYHSHMCYVYSLQHRPGLDSVLKQKCHFFKTWIYFWYEILSFTHPDNKGFHTCLIICSFTTLGTSLKLWNKHCHFYSKSVRYTTWWFWRQLATSTSSIVSLCLPVSFLLVPVLLLSPADGILFPGIEQDSHLPSSQCWAPGLIWRDKSLPVWTQTLQLHWISPEKSFTVTSECFLIFLKTPCNYTDRTSQETGSLHTRCVWSAEDWQLGGELLWEKLLYKSSGTCSLFCWLKLSAWNSGCGGVVEMAYAPLRKHISGLQMWRWMRSVMMGASLVHVQSGSQTKIVLFLNQLKWAEKLGGQGCTTVLLTAAHTAAHSMTNPGLCGECFTIDFYMGTVENSSDLGAALVIVLLSCLVFWECCRPHTQFIANHSQLHHCQSCRAAAFLNMSERSWWHQIYPLWNVKKDSFSLLCVLRPDSGSSNRLWTLFLLWFADLLHVP